MMQDDKTLRPRRTTRRSVGIVLLCIPIAILGVIGLFGLVSWQVVTSTLAGMAVAIVGGVILGMVAKRFLALGKGNTEILFGLAATTAIGVLTIGYIYLFHFKEPFQSIGTLSRTVEQTLIFVEFLVAEYAGAAWFDHLWPQENP